MSRHTTRRSPTPIRPLITLEDVNAVAEGGTLPIPPSAILTPLARSAVLERRVKLVVQAGAGRDPRTVAIGADHGGYALKQFLRAELERRFNVIDCGTHSPESCDYPDYALAVAQHVASGRAWRGIMIDGAGIGSCMVANKVPGVRAAMCYDRATAVNSREHNDANLLTLGAGMISKGLAREIVAVWLETDFAGGRHARRVDKIAALDADRRR
ncbi:MAG: ribose 5-phosphate isomerase B [Aggregatilineales bacterium]